MREQRRPLLAYFLEALDRLDRSGLTPRESPVQLELPLRPTKSETAVA